MNFKATEPAPEPLLSAFASLQLIEPLLRALISEGYTTPTPIQTLAVPPVLEGRDVLGWAQTGTGKTAAFALPVLQILHQNPLSKTQIRRPGAARCLVLAPTRELANQIDESFGAYGRHTGIKHTVVFGGVGMMPQVNALRRGVDVLVATPGRLLDHLEKGNASLAQLEILILDEADRMLDMGFIHDIRKIMKMLPAKRQTLLFSATMAPEIQGLAKSLLNNPVIVEVAPISSTAETVTQALYFVEKKEKPGLLKHLIEKQSIARTLVFTRTKHTANKVAEFLQKSGIGSEAFHSNKSQNARLRALENFKNGRVRVLVATDIAARGIDIDEISHVFNFDLPNEPEAYVHRIGRTGRAGASGQAISFCSMEEREFLPYIERTIAKHVPIVSDHPFSSPERPPLPTDLSGKRGQGPRPPQARRTGGGGGGGPQGQGRGRGGRDGGRGGRDGGRGGQGSRDGGRDGGRQGQGAGAGAGGTARPHSASGARPAPSRREGDSAARPERRDAPPARSRFGR